VAAAKNIKNAAIKYPNSYMLLKNSHPQQKKFRKQFENLFLKGWFKDSIKIQERTKITANKSMLFCFAYFLIGNRKSPNLSPLASLYPSFSTGC